MRLNELVEKLEEVSTSRIVGIRINNQDIQTVNYFYNPTVAVVNPSQYIVNNMDNVIFDTYSVGYSTYPQNKLGSLFVTSHKEYTFRELLDNNVEDIKFYTLVE